MVQGARFKTRPLPKGAGLLFFGKTGPTGSMQINTDVVQFLAMVVRGDL